MRRAAKIDDNQNEIVQALRSIGAGVLSLAPLGKGCPDLLVCLGENTLLMEIKDGKKIPSKRKLTPAQVDFHATWPGKIAVVTSVDEALKIILK